MATSPDQVRAGLALVAAEAAAQVEAAGQSAETAEELRAVLFLAAPIIVSDYSDGAAALALDWYEELREAAEPRRPFSPEPVRLVTDEYVKSVVAATTKALAEPDLDGIQLANGVVLRLVSSAMPEIVMDGFRDTITANSRRDPAAAGWRRFARPDACKFCKMLADKGAVFTEKTARFAAHGAVMAGNRKGGDCKCIAAPEFGSKDSWVEAAPIQYVASRRRRTPAQKAELRDYLNENFPDAPG